MFSAVEPRTFATAMVFPKSKLIWSLLQRRLMKRGLRSYFETKSFGLSSPRRIPLVKGSDGNESLPQQLLNLRMLLSRFAKKLLHKIPMMPRPRGQSLGSGVSSRFPR